MPACCDYQGLCVTPAEQAIVCNGPDANRFNCQPLADAAVADLPSASEVAASCGADYLACGCGCCGGPPAGALPRCYYASAGESAATVQAADLATKNATNCNLVGCALGVQYTCCADLAPDPTNAATYAAGYGSSNGGEISIVRNGPWEKYGASQITLVNSPTQARAGYQLTLPGTWGVEFAVVLSQGAAATPNNAIGGHGAIRIGASGTDCVLDAHLTLFFTDVGTTSPVKSVRFDVDDLVIVTAPASLCGAAGVNLDAGT